MNNPFEVREAGLDALQKALGTVGMVKFIQQYETGYGDYTAERQKEEDINIDDLDGFLKK